MPLVHHMTSHVNYSQKWAEARTRKTKIKLNVPMFISKFFCVRIYLQLCHTYISLAFIYVDIYYTFFLLLPDLN